MDSQKMEINLINSQILQFIFQILKPQDPNSFLNDLNSSKPVLKYPVRHLFAVHFFNLIPVFL
jgi:hypothetical protein